MHKCLYSYKFCIFSCIFFVYFLVYFFVSIFFIYAAMEPISSQKLELRV